MFEVLRRSPWYWLTRPRPRRRGSPRYVVAGNIRDKQKV